MVCTKYGSGRISPRKALIPVTGLITLQQNENEIIPFYSAGTYAFLVQNLVQRDMVVNVYGLEKTARFVKSVKAIDGGGEIENHHMGGFARIAQVEPSSFVTVRRLNINRKEGQYFVGTENLFDAKVKFGSLRSIKSSLTDDCQFLADDLQAMHDKARRYQNQPKLKQRYSALDIKQALHDCGREAAASIY